MSQHALIEAIETEQLKSEIPKFAVGDTLKVSIRIKEGKRERVQVFTGTVIAVDGHGLSRTMTLYRIAYGCSMERVFQLHSPLIEGIEVMRHGKTRRSKLHHIRGHQGKKAKIKERIVARKGKAVAFVEPNAPAPEAVAPVEDKVVAEEKPKKKAPAKKKEEEEGK